MAESFDPYHKWLGIPPKEQPPHHYRLLGIETLESDPDVIQNAADQRLQHVRSYQNGPYAAESRRLSDEIAVARQCLLDARRRADYNSSLARLAKAAAATTPPPKLESPRARPTPRPEPAPVPAVVPKSEPAPVPPVAFRPPIVQAPPPLPARAPKTPAEKLKSAATLLLIMGWIEGVGAALLLVLSILMILFPTPRQANDPDPPNPAVMLILFTVGVVRSSLVIAGAMSMQRRKSYALAMLTAALAVIPIGGCCLISLPCGIGALVMLSDLEVKKLFG